MYQQAPHVAPTIARNYRHTPGPSEAGRCEADHGARGAHADGSPGKNAYPANLHSNANETDQIGARPRDERDGADKWGKRARRRGTGISTVARASEYSVLVLTEGSGASFETVVESGVRGDRDETDCLTGIEFYAYQCAPDPCVGSTQIWGDRRSS